MHKAERVGRFVCLTLLGSTALALAGCGGDDSGTSNAATSSAGTTTTSPDTGSTSGSSSGSTTSGSGSTSSSGTPGTSTSVTPPASSASSSLTFNWVAPTENSNGSPLTNLAGYKIHYGTTSQDYTEVVAVNNPSLNRYVLDSLAKGTYYFAITAYNSAGVESALSGEISTTLN